MIVNPKISEGPLISRLSISNSRGNVSLRVTIISKHCISVFGHILSGSVSLILPAQALPISQSIIK